MEGRVDSNETQTFPKLPVVVTEMRQGVYRHLAESTVSLRRGPRASAQWESHSPQLWTLFKKDFHFPATVLLKPVWQPVTDARLRHLLHSPYSTAGGSTDQTRRAVAAMVTLLVCFKTVQV